MKTVTSFQFGNELPVLMAIFIVGYQDLNSENWELDNCSSEEAHDSQQF